jgi:hypothetical protein
MDFFNNLSLAFAIPVTTIVSFKCINTWLKMMCFSDCGLIENLYISNTASVELLPKNDTTFESSALVTCDVGHVVADRDNFQNQFNMTCGQDGKWNKVTDCVRIGIVF